MLHGCTYGCRGELNPFSVSLYDGNGILAWSSDGVVVAGQTAFQVNNVVARTLKVQLSGPSERVLELREVQAFTGCLDPPSGLVSWWGGDNNALDMVGANHGELRGDAAYAAGKVGQAVNFDGDGDYVNINNTSSMDFGTGDFTVDLWVKLNSLLKDQMFIQKYTGDIAHPENSKSYLMQFVPPSSLRFLVFDTISNKNDIIVSVSPSLNIGQWYHVAGVRSGNNSKLYLDGSLIAEQDAGNNMDTGTGGTAYLGNMVPTIPGDTRFLNGYLDEVAIFSRALSANEIEAIYNAGSAGKCIPDTTPGNFTFPDITNVERNTVYESNVLTVSGIDYATPISTIGGTDSGYSISTDGGSNWSTFTDLPGTVNLGDQIKVRQTSSASFSTATTTALTIGTVSGTFSVTTRIQSADLSIAKTSAPSPPVMGQKLTYTLTVTNNGPDGADGVTVTDVLGPGLTFGSAAGCNYDGGTRTVTCALGSLIKDEQKSVEIEVIPTVAGLVSNSAAVSSTVSDPVGGNDSSVRDVTVEVHLYLPLLLKN